MTFAFAAGSSFARPAIVGRDVNTCFPPETELEHVQFGYLSGVTHGPRWTFRFRRDFGSFVWLAFLAGFARRETDLILLRPRNLCRTGITRIRSNSKRGAVRVRRAVPQAAETRPTPPVRSP